MAKAVHLSSEGWAASLFRLYFSHREKTLDVRYVLPHLGDVWPGWCAVKFLDRLATFFAQRMPAVTRIHRRLGEALEDQRDTREAFGQMATDLKLRKAEAEERLTSIEELRFAEKLCRIPQGRLTELAESLATTESDSGKGKADAVFRERLWDLELALEDRGWVRETTLAALEFSRFGVQRLITICRIYGIKNPIVKRIAEICELYVFGRGIEIRSDNDAANEVIQDFLAANDAEMGHNGLAQKERDVQTDGAQYFGLATDPNGTVRVIMVDPLEIMDVVVDPDDSAHPLYFRRQWNRAEINYANGYQTTQFKQCWYPSLEMWIRTQNGQPQQPKMGGVEINWAMPILRDSAGASPAKWRWPVPPVYAAIDWARAYKDALEDYATVRRTLARFALMVETKGGPGAIAAYNALFSTTLFDSSGQTPERNPPPVTGAVHTSGPGTKIDAFKSAGAQANPEETRRLLLMSCAAAGMPETFFGDASTGSLATAVSLDRPTELKFTAIQRRWVHTLTMILTYVLAVSRTSPGGKLKESATANAQAKIIVKFPNVIEHSIKEMIQSIVEIGTLGGRNGIPAGIIDRRTIADQLLAEIGIEDRDKLLDEMGYGASYTPAADIIDQRTQAAPQSITGTDPNADQSAPKPKAKPAAAK